MNHIRSNRTRIGRWFFAAVSVFLLVFGLRLSYELVFSNNDIIVTAPHHSSAFNPYAPRLRTLNVATDKITQRGITGDIVTIDQKYEKTANISSVSTRFDDDHARLRALIDAHDAIVQTENLQGLPGGQELSMTIGVTPQHFDYMVEGLRGLGSLRSFTVNQVDKTNEFNSLLANQEVLRMTRASYASLQEMGGSIQDMLLLQERILIVETELQHLSVDLGIFATEHSFCTINFVLREQEAASISVRFVLWSAFDSFTWTVAAVVVMSLVAIGLLGAVVLGLWLRILIGKLMQGPVSGPDDIAN